MSTPFAKTRTFSAGKGNMWAKLHTPATVALQRRRIQGGRTADGCDQ